VVEHPRPLGTPSPGELLARLDAERSQQPFLLFQDHAGAQVIASLDTQASPMRIGRGAACDLPIHWDDSMSRVHAELIALGDEWAIVDDGLSRNGSFVNGGRVNGRRRLREGDVLRLGRTTFVYRSPTTKNQSTELEADIPTTAQLSPAQRRVLIALARPFRDATGFVTPATNQEIAAELFLSIDSVKTHLRAVSAKFGVQDLPQNQKRAKLVERGFASGIITQHDLSGPQQP
jgi:pSer/pThr/pTyr-binding forkhead associated (FHA) protein